MLAVKQRINSDGSVGKNSAAEIPTQEASSQLIYCQILRASDVAVQTPSRQAPLLQFVTENSQEIVDLLADIASRRAILLNLNSVTSGSTSRRSDRRDSDWTAMHSDTGGRRSTGIVRDGIPEPQMRYDRSGFEIRRRLNLEIASSFLGRMFPFSLCSGLGAPSPLPIRQ